MGNTSSRSLQQKSANFAYQITKEPPWSRDRFDRVIADVARAKGANDAVYVYFYSVAPFMYYAPRFGWEVVRSGFDDFSVTNGHVVRGAPPDKPNSAIISHPNDGINEPQLLHYAVQQRGGTIETVSVHGTAVAYRIQFP